ncbi:hypothetical protein GMLC_02490 [Geomonas limicola]|uniref:HD/PDEase domain-containing protein n=1 Tax=Geomonas limicola TaxID=2740186 RepID=A0A6V8N2T5_9BACT|nr:HD domain-containing protein [Geomonas limicola]GFO66670.1 hypothetical protein GMLC_02490 [Geomonas limicola]
MTNDLIQRARLYATEMHERINQRRKYTHQPYPVHLKAVADLVAQVGCEPEVVAAAWLHDTVEDTPATFEELERDFGKVVMTLVAELTDISRVSDGNRAARKEIDRRHLAAASPRAKTVKLADIIDNTRDIARHDPRFARTYLPEMFQLLEVLTEGNTKLYQKAQRAVTECARSLGLDVPPALLPVAVRDATPVSPLSEALGQMRGLQLFTESFSARSIFEPLCSFDRGVSWEQLRESFSKPGVGVVGVREEGYLTGYLLEEDIDDEGGVGEPRGFASLQLVSLETPLAEIIHSLTYHSHCFVTLEREIIGVIGRFDIEKPAARMWLFGLIMVIDNLATGAIREYWHPSAWQELLTEGRRSKAEALYLERQRRKMPGTLLDCLQFSDKLQILMDNDGFLEVLGFASVKAAKRVVADLESLRNNLAHGQQIANADWPAIARLARMFEEASGAPGVTA